MDITKAREIIRSLAEGVDPTTEEVLPNENIHNKPEVIRALYPILEATAPKPVQPVGPYRNAGKPLLAVQTKIRKWASRFSYTGRACNRNKARNWERESEPISDFLFAFLICIRYNSPDQMKEVCP